MYQVQSLALACASPKRHESGSYHLNRFSVRTGPDFMQPYRSESGLIAYHVYHIVIPSHLLQVSMVEDSAAGAWLRPCQSRGTRSGMTAAHKCEAFGQCMGLCPRPLRG